MKQVFVMSALVAAMLASVTANAADMVSGKDQKTLGVKATISAPSCSFDMNGGDDVSFDTINPTTLNLNSETRLEAKSGKFTIECDAETMVQMSVIDTYATALRAGDHPSLFSNYVGKDGQFGLVDASDPSKLMGSYIITSLDPRDEKNDTQTIHLQDGQPLSVLHSINGAEEPVSMVFGTSNGVFRKTLNVGFKIEPSFLAKSKLGESLGQEVQVLGETTFKMVYM